MTHRIAAGAIVFSQGKVLLVRHVKPGSYDFLVMPGGGVNLNEDARAAAKREVREEAGLDVDPLNLAYVEELKLGELRTCKLWFRCDGFAGTLSADADEAKRELIVHADFYARDEIQDKIAFPPVHFTDEFWTSAKQRFPGTEYLGLREQMF